MQHYFGPRGTLSEKVPGFEFRSSQLQMAEAVFASLKDGLPLLVEAGTGTGKTWAYLIPALLSDRRVVVSTGTKTLQDQILDHDIPFLKAHLFPRLRTVCLKGRKNYLCRRKLRLFARQPSLWSREEAMLFQRFQNWALSTSSGDRAEIDWLPDEFHTWNEVSSSGDQCLGQQCSDYSRCFLTLLRQEAARADLLIVNHHLYLADLALRVSGRAEILPEYDAVIFDEAHQLEDVVSLHFGWELSNAKIRELIRDIERESTGKSFRADSIEQLKRIGGHLEILSRQLHQHLAHHAKGFQGRFPLRPEVTGGEFSSTCRQMIHALEQLSAQMTLLQSNAIFDSFIRRSEQLSSAVREVMEQSDPGLVYWYELSPRSVLVHGTPIETGPLCSRWLFGQNRAVVFTSATLTTGGSFDYLRRNLGVPAECRELLLQSPFAFSEQALLYIPEHVPEPQSADFCAFMAREAADILAETRGRALFLFTSYRNMNALREHLQGKLPYPVLVQGERPKRQLLAEFKQQIDSVLLATGSFWQGVDVPGEALSCLLIDKLPFEVPEDPLTAARIKHLRESGRNPFYQYQVPRAIIQLKQGVGRLIRSSRDRGVIVIFDIRLFGKPYGKLFLESLPPCSLTRRSHGIGDFFFASDSSSSRPDNGRGHFDPESGAAAPSLEEV